MWTLSGVTGGTCTRTGLGIIKDLLFFTTDDGFTVMQENVFIFQKCIFMHLGKTSRFKDISAKK